MDISIYNASFISAMTLVKVLGLCLIASPTSASIRGGILKVGFCRLLAEYEQDSYIMLVFSDPLLSELLWENSRRPIPQAACQTPFSF
jgi:hypothetical protein